MREQLEAELKQIEKDHKYLLELYQEKRDKVQKQINEIDHREAVYAGTKLLTSIKFHENVLTFSTNAYPIVPERIISIEQHMEQSWKSVKTYVVRISYRALGSAQINEVTLVFVTEKQANKAYEKLQQLIFPML